MLVPEAAAAVPVLCLESSLLLGGPRAPGVFINGCLDVITPVSLLRIGALPGPVLRAERGGPPGLSWDLRRSPPGPELCHRGLPGRDSGPSVPSTCQVGLQHTCFEAAHSSLCLLGGSLQSRGVGWKDSRDKLLSPLRSQSQAGPSPGSAAGHPGESDSASLGLALLTFRSRTHCCGEGRPEWSQGVEAALRQAPASLHLLVVTSICETSTYPAWPHSPWGDLPGDVGGNIQLSR